MQAKDFGVLADGVTNDASALQKAINESIDAGAVLALPTGTINIGNGNPALLLNRKISGGFAQGVKMTGTAASNDATGTILSYSGTGTALRADNGCPAPTANIRLSNFQVINTRAAATAIDLSCVTQAYVDHVTVNAGGRGINWTNGFRLNGLNIAWLDLNTLACGDGSIGNGFLITGSGTAAIYIRGTNAFGARNFIAFEGGVVANGVTVSDSWIEGADVFVRIDDSPDPGPSVSGLNIERNMLNFDRAEINSALMLINNTNGRQLWATDMYFNRNRAGCPQASYGHG